MDTQIENYKIEICDYTKANLSQSIIDSLISKIEKLVFEGKESISYIQFIHSNKALFESEKLRINICTDTEKGIIVNNPKFNITNIDICYPLQKTVIYRKLEFYCLTGINEFINE